MSETIDAGLRETGRHEGCAKCAEYALRHSEREEARVRALTFPLSTTLPAVATNESSRTVSKVVRKFANAQRAHKYFVTLRWPNGVACPRMGCGSTGVTYYAKHLRWYCKDCRGQFTAKVGTIFEDSPIGFNKWLPAMWMIASGIDSSSEIARQLKVTQKSAWLMLQRVQGRVISAVMPSSRRPKKEANTPTLSTSISPPEEPMRRDGVMESQRPAKASDSQGREGSTPSPSAKHPWMEGVVRRLLKPAPTDKSRLSPRRCLECGDESLMRTGQMRCLDCRVLLLTQREVPAFVPPGKCRKCYSLLYEGRCLKGHQVA